MLLENTAAWIVANDDGTGQSGGVWDTEWVRAAAASIDAVLQSATNPAITPAALIDEVVAARGSKASLDARLDVALEEDGTPKAVAGQASNANLQAILQSRNVMLNGNLEDWTLGGALAPDNFVLSGAAATIARTGPAMADTFTFGTGTYAAKITRAGTDAKLLQTIISAGDMPAAADIKGEKIGILVMGKTAIANHLRIVVDDGVLTTATSYHTGGGTAEALTAVHTISAAATKLEVYAQVNNSNGDAYVGGWTAVFSNLAPTRWLPLDVTQIANANHGGTLAVGAQTIPGDKTFAGLVTLATTLFQALPTGPGSFKFTRQTADFTKNASTVLGDITGLNFAVGANETWAFIFIMKGISAAAADFKFALTGPAAPTAVWYGVPTANLGVAASAVAAFGSSCVVTSSGFEDCIILLGLLRNGANAGTVQVQMAQNTSDVSNSVIRAESIVIPFRLV